ncbi:MAG: TIGR03545 family protein [Bdellovibrio sp.]|nr:MAG: TIGR03545 family protein [Bdellovibrio sp.]
MKKLNKVLRTEAIIPILVILTLSLLYFSFLFDSHLKKTLEWSLTHIYGAEVNIKKIKTSFINGSFQLSGLQITDKKKPERNILQIQKIYFHLLWDALLRAKFVINQAEVQNIQVFVPRKKRGKVYPPSPKSQSVLQKTEYAILEKTQKDFNNNILGDIATVLTGVDPSKQFTNIKEQLKSEKFLEELNMTLKNKQKEWEERLKTLPQGKEIDSLVQKAKKIHINTKNPILLFKSLEELQTVIKEGDRIIKEYNAAQKDLDKDLNQLNSSYKDLEKWIQKDLADLQRRFNLPNINPQEFSKGLFGMIFAEKIASLYKYQRVAQEYMPPNLKKNKKQKSKEIVPPKRGMGKTYTFPITKGYPQFWLKKAIISSLTNSKSPYSGQVKGTLTHLSSHPSIIPFPTKFNLVGDFPNQNIHGLNLHAVIDHRTSTPTEKATLTIDSYPVDKRVLSHSKDVSFIIQKATGKLLWNIQMKSSIVNLKLKNWFSNVQYKITATNPIVQEVLTNTVNGIPVISVFVKAQGSWEHLKWSLFSNLGSEISKNLSKQVQAQIEKAKKQLNLIIQKRLQDKRLQVQNQFKQLTDQVTQKITSRQKKLEKEKKALQAKAQKAQTKSQKAKQKALEKAGKELLKKLKF